MVRFPKFVFKKGLLIESMSIKVMVYWIMTFKDFIKVITYSIKTFKKSIKTKVYLIITFIDSIKVMV